MDVPNLSGGPAVTPQTPKSKFGIFAVAIVAVALVAGGYYYFTGSPAGGPPSLEQASQSTQGFIKAKGLDFLVPTAEDDANFSAKAKKFVTDKMLPTALKATKTNKGMHYIYWDGTLGQTASFQDVVENANPTKAKMLFVAKWNSANNYFDTTPHNYYKKEKDGKIVTKIAEMDQFKTIDAKQSGGIIFAAADSTEIYGFKDGNTFAAKAYGICNTTTPNGWHLFAAETNKAADIFKDCKTGQIKEFHIQTSVDPVTFTKGTTEDTLKYSMVWALKGDEVVVGTGGQGTTPPAPEMKDHHYTVEGANLKVKFVGTTTDEVYELAKTPANLVVTASKGFAGGDQDDEYVKVFTSDNKYIGYFEFKNTTAKEFSAVLDPAYATKYTFTLAGKVISLKVVPVDEGLKTDNSLPAKSTWVTPSEGTTLNLDTLKKDGLAIVASDPNTKSLQKIDGKYASNYSFKLTKGTAQVWIAEWKSNFPTGSAKDTTDCIRETSYSKSGGKEMVWKCPYATIPASAFATATPGDYSLAINTGDGNVGSGDSTVNFKVVGTEVPKTDNVYTLNTDGTITVAWKNGGTNTFKVNYPPSSGGMLFLITQNVSLSLASSGDDNYIKITSGSYTLGYSEIGKLDWDVNKTFTGSINAENKDAYEVKTTATEVTFTKKESAPTKTDLTFSLSGNTLNVTWQDGKKSTYTVTAPAGATLGLNDTKDNLLVWQDSAKTKLIALIFQFDSNKNELMLSEGYKTVEDTVTANITSNTITITVTPTEAPSTPHSEIIKAFNEGLIWDKVENSSTKWTAEQDDSGTRNFTYKIYLNDAAKAKLAAAKDDQFYFQYAYKPHWGVGAEELKTSSVINFKVTPGPKLELSSPNDKDVKAGLVYTGDDGTIYVNVKVPWPGFGAPADAGFENWGKTDVDMYFFDTVNGPTAAKQISIPVSYRNELIKKPELYVNASSSGCVGYDDWDFQIGNSGGKLPSDAYYRIRFYVSGDGYGPETLNNAFGDASPILAGGGATSDWECHDSGSDKVWLVRDSIEGATIWSKKF